MRELAEISRQKRLLDVSRNIDFLLHALALALAFHKSRVIQNARRVSRKGIQNLPVQF